MDASSTTRSTVPQTRGRARLRWPAMALACFVLLTWVLTGAGLAYEQRSIDRLHVSLAEARAAEDLSSIRIGTLQEEQGSLQTRVAQLFDPSTIVTRSQISVFTLVAGAWQGSAFVLSSSGGRSELVTNFHVVRSLWTAGVRRVVVRNADGSFNGTIVDVSPGADLAIVEVHGTLPALAPDLGQVVAGEQVVVVGSPYGFGGTVSTGVISAIRRRYLQFSAPVSPGSSGGPVLDGQGRVIGVAAAKVEGPGAEGLSFAIPIDRVCRLTVAC